jgi:hypothetical protein
MKANREDIEEKALKLLEKKLTGGKKTIAKKKKVKKAKGKTGEINSDAGIMNLLGAEGYQVQNQTKTKKKEKK